MTVRKNMMSTISSRVTSHFAISALTVSMIAISSTAYAQQGINSVSVVQTSPVTTQLKLSFDGTPVTPTAYQLKEPTQLILDFNQVRNNIPQRFNEYHTGSVSEVTTLTNNATTRLIVGLEGDNNYTTTTAVQGNDLLISITRPQASVQAVQYSATNNSGLSNSALTTPAITPIVENNSTASAGRVQNSTQNNTEKSRDTMVVKVNPLLNPALATSAVGQQYSYEALKALNFSGGSDGGGNINITLANDAIPIDVQRQGNRLVVRMTGGTIPRRLLQRLNVNGGLVQSIDANNQGQNGVVTINMSGDYEYQAYQSGNQLHININKPKPLRQPTLEEKVYTGEPLSMEFQDVEIRSVLDILAQFTEMNIVASDAVSGSITLRLINVPWDQALDIILESKGLGKRENGNVILVAPEADLIAQEQAKREAQIASVAVEPLRTEYIQLNYANAQNILALISQGRSANNNNQENSSLLSNRGTVTIDARTNTLIVKDTANSIENIHALIEKIDVPVKQVMIEARIVSASESFSKELGVRWGILSNGAANNRNLLVGSNLNTVNSLKNFDIQTTTINGQQIAYPSYDINSASNLNVDLGASSAAGRIAFGLLSMSDMMLDLELSAMQADNRGEVISSPKVLTADKQTAKVSSGTQIPYQEASASGATSTSFAEAALSLEATPSITPDGKIGLELNITNGTPTIINGGVAIAEDSINTNVIVEDGQTVVLGGIFKNQISNDVSKVPFLGDLPYVGRAFRRDARRNDKQELLIFVTPKLVNDGVSRLR